MKKSFQTGLYFAIIACLLAPATIYGTEAQETTVLTVRPEKINPHQTGPLTLKRDPFNWTEKQVRIFKARDRKNRSELFAGLTLTGIIWDSKKPLAIINGKMLGSGDIINGTRIKKIYKKNVLLLKNGVIYSLEFEPAIVDMGFKHAN